MFAARNLIGADEPKKLLISNICNVHLHLDSLEIVLKESLFHTTSIVSRTNRNFDVHLISKRRNIL